jgi:hypothetical protein
MAHRAYRFDDRTHPFWMGFVFLKAAARFYAAAARRLANCISAN